MDRTDVTGNPPYRSLGSWICSFGVPLLPSLYRVHKSKKKSRLHESPPKYESHLYHTYLQYSWFTVSEYRWLTVIVVVLNHMKSKKIICHQQIFFLLRRGKPDNIEHSPRLLLLRTLCVPALSIMPPLVSARIHLASFTVRVIGQHWQDRRRSPRGRPPPDEWPKKRDFDCVHDICPRHERFLNW